MQSRYEEARPLLERAVRAAPTDARFVTNLGLMYYLTGDYEIHILSSRTNI